MFRFGIVAAVAVLIFTATGITGTSVTAENPRPPQRVEAHQNPKAAQPDTNARAAQKLAGVQSAKTEKHPTKNSDQPDNRGFDFKTIVETISAAITAAFTAALAFWTLGLKKETSRLVEGGEKQLTKMDESTTAAQRAAKAAEDAIEVSRDIGKKQTRPYLILDTKNIETAIGQNGISNVFIRVPMKNYGTTPAIDPNIACNCRVFFKDGFGKSYAWFNPLVRNEEIGTTIGPNSEYRGIWQTTVIDGQLSEPLWHHDRPQFSLSARFSDPNSYPIGVMVDILFTYLDLAREIQAREYYRLDARIEKRDEFFKAKVLRVPRDPQGAGDIYPLG